jgi:hypothetical protein
MRWTLLPAIIGALPENPQAMRLSAGFAPLGADSTLCLAAPEPVPTGALVDIDRWIDRGVLFQSMCVRR